MSHTPGPWRYDPEYPCIRGNAYPDYYWEEEDRIPENQTKVVTLTGAMSGEDTKADAALIASAPELLTMLKELLKHSIEAREVVNEYRNTQGEDELSPHPLFALVQQVINKAEGK